MDQRNGSLSSGAEGKRVQGGQQMPSTSAAAAAASSLSHSSISNVSLTNSLSSTTSYTSSVNQSSSVHSNSSTSALPMRLFNPPSTIAYGRLRFLIMDAPSSSTIEAYLDEMERRGVQHLVRVCDPTYSREVVEARGIRLHELHFPDGDSPPQSVLNSWLNLLRQTFSDVRPLQNGQGSVNGLSGSSNSSASGIPPAIAVHCVAGLGRAPVLVAIGLIEEGMSALDAVSYVRQRRRGAINNKQLRFLESYRPRRSGSNGSSSSSTAAIGINATFIDGEGSNGNLMPSCLLQ